MLSGNFSAFTLDAAVASMNNVNSGFIRVSFLNSVLLTRSWSEPYSSDGRQKGANRL
jgi:hypothetical protein